MKKTILLAVILILVIFNSPASYAQDQFIQKTLNFEVQNLLKQLNTPEDIFALAIKPNTGEIIGLIGPHNITFEPGACMKIFALGCALAGKKIDHKTRFYCPGYGVNSGRKIRCHEKHGLINPYDAIGKSCNSAIVEISKLLNNQELYSFYNALGFNNKKLLFPEKWPELLKTKLCFGQEISVNPFQLATAYSAIANDGKVLELHSHGNKSFNKTERQKVFEPELALELRKILKKCGENYQQLSSSKYSIGGILSLVYPLKKNGKSSNKQFLASFIGMAPALNPKVVFLIVVRNPRGKAIIKLIKKRLWATSSKFVEKTLKYLKVSPDR